MCKTNKSIQDRTTSSPWSCSDFVSWQKGLWRWIYYKLYEFNVLSLAVHQVNFFCWMDQGDYSCDFSVSPSPFGLDLGTLDLGLRTWAWQYYSWASNISQVLSYQLPVTSYQFEFRRFREHFWLRQGAQGVTISVRPSVCLSVRS